MNTDYKTQAEKFLADTETEFKAEFKKFGKHFEDDKDARLIFTITLKRGSRSYSLDFGSSLKDAEDVFRSLIGLGEYWNDKDCKHKDKITMPTAYDVLACLTKYDPGTFEDFCREFGYDEDSRTADKIYKAVKNEYLELSRLYSDKELEALQDIS